MTLDELLKKLDCIIVEDDGTIEYMYSELGGKYDGKRYYNEKYDIEAATISIDKVELLVYRNYIPLWRRTDIYDCFTSNWFDLFPTQEFFILPARDVSEEKLSDIYHYIKVSIPNSDRLIAFEYTSEGF